MGIELTDHQTGALHKLVTGVRKHEYQEQTLGGYAGTGKAQPLDSIIITPQGAKQMGDIKVGDEICTPSGEDSKVTGVFPQGVKSIYRIWFNDGHSVECCDEHLWKCIDRRRLSNLKKYKTPYKVFPLSYIREFLTRADGRNRFYIETSAPINFQNTTELLIDPYLMGVFLADSSITDNNFAIHSDDEEIICRCRNLLLDWSCRLEHKKGVTYSIVGPFSTSVSIRNVLRDLGIWNHVCDTKFVPSSFLYASLEDRWELLRGLMDSDGEVDKRTGMVGYTTTSSRLAADICWLIESLGGICRIKNKDTKCVYKGKVVLGQAWVLNISFNNTPNVFFLSRKKQLAKPRTKYFTRRCIRDVEYVGEKEAQCIMIDHSDHLYLTDHFVPTHNTTLIKYLTRFFPKFAVCAYTGKAANVLRTKGMYATTIHSRIYKPFFENGVVYFDLADNPDCEGFIVDEASMVSEEIYEDLKSFKKPMVFVGDHGQLEPVDSGFNLMTDPDYKLEKIHRNAGDIAKFAEHIRNGFAPRGFQDEGDKVNFLGNSRMTDELLTEMDQVICAFNKTRVGVNNRIRAALGHEGQLNVGERIMCLKNNRELGLFNGMQCTVLDIYKGKRGANYIDFDFDNTTYKGINIDYRQFGQESYKKIGYGGGSKSPNPFDYSYCITCHKAQGDEWNKILVLEQKCKNWSHIRWAYTAASRARTQLYWNLSR